MKRLVLSPLFFCFVQLAIGQTAIRQPAFDTKSSIHWIDMEIRAQTALNLASANIKLPGGRALAQELVEREYFHLIRPAILNIQVDSSRTVGDLLSGRELNFADIEGLSRPASRMPPALSKDMGFMLASYTVSLKAISEALLRHSRPSPIRRPLSPTKTPAYTGVVIIATGSLPIHGRNTRSLVQPCIFPKIWDTDMNLIYERSMTDPDKHKGGVVKYVAGEAVFRPTPSGMDEDLEALVGENP
ncbi:MAG: polymerase, partial [Treponema sp.]|nr:polymerase [Treponema sp.]